MRVKMDMDKFIKAATDAPRKFAAAFKKSEVNTMGKEFYCDLCRAGVPLETALQKVSIGNEDVADLCLTCASNLKNGIRKEIADAVAKMQAAQKAIPAAQAQEPPAPAPAQPQSPAALATAPAP